MWPTILNLSLFYFKIRSFGFFLHLWHNSLSEHIEKSKIINLKLSKVGNGCLPRSRGCLPLPLSIFSYRPIFGAHSEMSNHPIYKSCQIFCVKIISQCLHPISVTNCWAISFSIISTENHEEALLLYVQEVLTHLI